MDTALEKKVEPELSYGILTNPARVVPAQEKHVRFLEGTRYVPIKLAPSGFVLLKDLQPSKVEVLALCDTSTTAPPNAARTGVTSTRQRNRQPREHALGSHLESKLGLKEENQSSLIWTLLSKFEEIGSRGHVNNFTLFLRRSLATGASSTIHLGVKDFSFPIHSIQLRCSIGVPSPSQFGAATFDGEQRHGREARRHLPTATASHNEVKGFLLSHLSTLLLCGKEERGLSTSSSAIIEL
ncbi:hypothetical protein ZIOFF_011716 [Zingiber officinale]|uniref:26S proteasome regulatory subunit RPN2 C-terminal domain-containing protein n=1 Tax=Zingiber officinale TaxID=94328 RepID=A0A8J5HNH9_ZINOF|nr:hypothetical protein ZIOFF_011716 [Zingiber officinale]